MTVAPFGSDSPDWTRNQGAAGAAVLNVNQAVHSATQIDTVYVGGWRTLLIDANMDVASVGRWQLAVSWFQTATALAGFAGSTLEIPTSPKGTAVVLPVMGPFARFTPVRLAGVGDETMRVLAIASAQTAPMVAGAHGTLLLDALNTVLPGAGTVTFSPTVVQNGVATLTVIGNDANWYAIVHKLTAAGALGAPLAFLDPVAARGATVRFGLPPVEVTLEVVNKAAPANNVSVTLGVDWQ